MLRRLMMILWLALAAPAALAQSSAPAAHATAKAIAAQVAALRAEMKAGQGFAWKPLVGSGTAVAAIEIWRKPGKPAVHPAEAEYATVVSGTGVLLSGGKMVEPVERRPGLVEGSRIEGGTTQALQPGDVIMVPAGVPHWFGITGGELVLLGTKLPQPGGG